MHSIKITIHVFVGFNRSFVYYLYAGVIQVQCIRLTLITLHRIITKGYWSVFLCVDSVWQIWTHNTRES